jgi:hypothetical protein
VPRGASGTPQRAASALAWPSQNVAGVMIEAIGGGG